MIVENANIIRNMYWEFIDKTALKSACNSNALITKGSRQYINNNLADSSTHSCWSFTGFLRYPTRTRLYFRDHNCGKTKRGPIRTAVQSCYEVSTDAQNDSGQAKCRRREKNCAVSVTLHAIKFKIILLVLEYLVEHQTRFHLHWLVVSCLGSHLFFVTSPNLEIVNIPAALILIEVRSSALKPTRRPANWPLSRWQKLNGASARSSEPNGDFPCKHNENISTLIKTKIAPAVEKQSFKHHMQNNSSGYNNLLL